MNVVFLAFSLSVHLSVLGTLFLWQLYQSTFITPRGLGGKLHLDAPPPLQLSFVPVDLKEAGLAQPSDRQGFVNVKQILKEAEERAAKLSDEQKLRELEKKLPELKNMSLSDVDQIASVVEKIRNATRDRQYAPVEGVAGEFDVASTIIYDIQKMTDEKGKVVYVFTLVDKDGRQLVHTVKGEEMTGADLTAYRVFEMARGNQALRRMVQTVQKLHASKQPAAAPIPKPPEKKDASPEGQGKKEAPAR